MLFSYVIIVFLIFIVLSIYFYYKSDGKIPIVVFLSCIIIFYLTSFSIPIKFTSLISMIVLYDLLLKLIGGQGIHDSQGVGWMQLFLLVGWLLSCIILIIYGVFEVENQLSFFIYCIVYTVIVFSYGILFSSVGLTIFSSPSKSIKYSKKKKIFISQATLSTCEIQYSNQSISIKNAWWEKHQKIQSFGFFSKKKDSGRFYCILEVEVYNNIINQFGRDTCFYKEKLTYGYTPISQIRKNQIVLLFDEIDTPKELNFYESKGRDMIIIETLFIK